MLNFRKKIRRCLSAALAAAMIIGCSAELSAVSHNYTAITPQEAEPDISTPATSATVPHVTPPVSTPATSYITPPVSESSTASGDITTDPTDTSDVSDTSDTSDTLDQPPEPAAIVLSFTEYSLEAGEGVQLQAQLINVTEDYPPISFYSSDTSVVRVDNSGYIIAVGAGNTTVTAYAGELSVSAAIYVSNPPVVPEYIVLTKDSFTLKINETAQIQAKLFPEEAAAGYTISYSSGNTEVAEVDENGLITALSEGEAYITVEGAGLYEIVHVTVSADIAYDTAKLDGYLYDDNGNPVSGCHLIIDDLSAVTDSNGYFIFESVEQRELSIKLADNENAVCKLTLEGDTTIYLLYNGKTLERLGSYEELAGQLAISSVEFISANIVLTVGEIYELSYQYEPRDATITEINYESSNPVALQVGQIDGVVTAKAPGEATVTLTLNGGQAETVCTITVNPKESSQYSILIVVIEAIVLVSLVSIVALMYRKYRKKMLEKINEDDDGSDDDLHDID